ncbi:hypothetical protein JKY72_01600 [Candidatus Gracilibacteria bacterium]|nr:hypothetical protein [Candidatus Gracilibacteria bacterium]
MQIVIHRLGILAEWDVLEYAPEYRQHCRIRMILAIKGEQVTWTIFIFTAGNCQDFIEQGPSHLFSVDVFDEPRNMI